MRTTYHRSNGPLTLLKWRGWTLHFGRASEESHTLYSSGREWRGMPWRRMISFQFLGWSVGLSQPRKSPPGFPSGLPEQAHELAPES